MGKKLFGFDTDKKWDYENGFYLTSPPQRLAKALAHYELYKSVIHLPGSVVECGVYKGASLIRFATFREVLESRDSRKIIGFDAFGKFPAQDSEDDDAFVQEFESAGGKGISVNELNDVLGHKNLSNIELIQGDITETVPRYCSEHAELKVSLLHIDVDVYKPTVVILNEIFDRVVKGGVIVLDDYGTVPGETRAVDEFLLNRNLKIEKLPLSHIPAFIRIP